MNHSSQTHLAGITEKSLTDWTHDNLFTTYASSTTKNGMARLGVNGGGVFATRVGSSKPLLHNSAKDAISYYAELLD